MKQALSIFLLFVGLSSAAFAYEDGQPKLNASTASLVNHVVQTCIVKSGRYGKLNPLCVGNSQFSLNLRKLSTEQDGNLYVGEIKINGGAKLGGLTIKLEVNVGGGMDADMNAVTFKDQANNVLGVYAFTSDDPQNGLAVLKSIQY